MKSFVCKQPQSLRDFTDCTYPQGSFCFARLLRERDIKVNGVRVGKNVELKAGDEVIYYTSAAQEGAPSHTVVYEDENLLAADKFSGVSTEGLCAELNTYGVFYPVHRLDRNTCGLIIFAKDEFAQTQLVKAFKERRVNKTYLAVCKNNFKRPSATLTAYIKKDVKSARVSVYAAPAAGLSKIVTEYRVLAEKGELALAEITLHTGKTHQIRAHMAHIGCPVLGDNKYGDETLNKKYKMARQCLASKRIKFTGLTGGLSYLNGKEFESRFDLDIQNILLKN